MEKQNILFFYKNQNLVKKCREIVRSYFNFFSTSDFFDFDYMIATMSNDYIFVEQEISKSDTNKKFFASCEKRNLLSKLYFITDSLFPENQNNERIITVPDGLKKLLQNIKAKLSEDEIKSQNQQEIVSSFLGVSPAIENLRAKLIKASSADFPVLILGESGVGKTFAAKIIHDLSQRSKNKFFSVNVSAISESLAESELFGTVKGAFTGAEQRKGYFASANEGTLFLDEIGEMSINIQVKLLHAIESGTYRSVGCDDEKKSNVKLIFATNADLKEKILNKQFRADFYYRINQFIIEIPPLRKRKEDIQILADDYLKKKNKQLSSSAAQFLSVYNWEGNVRQLYSFLNNVCLSLPEKNIIDVNDCMSILTEI